MAKSKKASLSHERSGFIKLYLLAYNLGQFTGWTYLLFQVVNHFLSGGKLSTLWDTVRVTVVIFQNAAILEILNVALGFVKSSVMITTFQVFSRVMVVCGVLLATPTAPQSIGLSFLLFAWSITEIIRYLFYGLSVVNMVPYFLIWCRYTFFYVLYPLGVTGELLCFYAAQAYVKKHELWDIELTSINVSFSYQSYHYFLLFVMLLYLPLFPRLYFHMISQRRKVIGGTSIKKAA